MGNSHTSRLLALLLLLSGLCSSACSPSSTRSERPAPRLVVLYATCTLNREYLGAYGQGISYTPNLDAFAAESVVFDRHQSESGQSGISFASIFSGTQADRHQVYHHPKKLSPDLYLITEAYKDAGYEPWFWSGHNMAAADLDYGQGVAAGNSWQPGPKGRRQAINSFLQPNDEMFQRVLVKLAADPEYKAFLLINFTVTHGAYHRQIPQAAYFEFIKQYPQAAEGLSAQDLKRAWEIYESVDPLEGKNWLNLQWDFENTVARLGLSPAQVQALIKALEVTYRADVAYLDSMFGNTMQTLQEQGLMDQSLIAFSADHGESLYRENALFHWTHGLQLAPEVLQVPLMIRAPMHASLGFRPGRYSEITRSIDVYPTLSGLCGIDLSGRGVIGSDLSDALLGLVPAPEQLAFSHTTTIGEDSIESFRNWEKAAAYWDGTEVERIWVRIREQDMVYKWVNSGAMVFEFRVHDLAQDPTESVNLYDASNESHQAKARLLRNYKALLVSRFDERRSADPEDAKTRLDDLGYTDGASEEDEDD